MTTAPVSLDEVRSFLRLAETDGHGDDDKLWATVLGAVRSVETTSGAIRPRQVVERLTLTCPYDGYGPLPLSEWPLLGDTAPSIASASSPWPSRYAYDVTYTVGYDPIPEDLIQAVLLQTVLDWGSQRGPESIRRWTAMAGAGISSPSGLDKKLLDDKLAPYRFSVPA